MLFTEVETWAWPIFVIVIDRFVNHHYRYRPYVTGCHRLHILTSVLPFTYPTLSVMNINKLLHSPNVAGQSLVDRVTAAKHSLAGERLAKFVCKATTEEQIPPKKKHIDRKLYM